MAKRTMTLPQTSEERKRVPLFSGVLRYFPAALAGVARVSKWGNDKHNPGQPLHHSRGKSNDHAECIMRHLTDMSENAGIDPESLHPQVDMIAWRALALAQEWHEQYAGAPLAPGAVLPDDVGNRYELNSTLAKVLREDQYKSFLKSGYSFALEDDKGPKF